MKQINGKYRTLKPEIEYLYDEVVIAQAWKKTHGYMRSFNWYADTLALDVSALGIEENAKSWGYQLKRKEKLYELELVPAAKSEAWVIDKTGWHSKKIPPSENKSAPLRPLAHLMVRDQTWASTAMLCLADAVESVQGNCSTANQTFEQAKANRVYSYGNRLVCDWNDNKKAWFRWGNSETYRKFFTDYQSFLKRPLEIGRKASEQALGADHVFVVNLDLSKFYNTINVSELLIRLRKISLGFGYRDCQKFWLTLEHITNWKWNSEDIELAKKLGIGNKGVIDKGLPQGLVASGFFANAYLVEFDRAMGALLDLEHGGILIHDYCRYVDDLRLVISCSSDDIPTIKIIVNELVNAKLLAHGGLELRLNDGKTKVTHLEELDNSGSLFSRVEAVQSELSGPADRDVLDSATGVLEGLLQIENDNLVGLKDSHKDSTFAQIVNFDHNVRPDTLKRFAANRLESISRSKRKFASTGGETDDMGSEGESELLAKKLIFAWMKDPSLALVLRKAIEIHPDADLFEPVLEAIFTRSNFPRKKTGTKMVTGFTMDYLLADLFRCGSDLNGYFQSINYPKYINPQSIIELIARYAQKVLASKHVRPFVARQALMLLAVVNKPTGALAYSGLIHSDLHLILVGNPPKYQYQKSALFEVAAQITDQFDSYASLFLDNIKGMKTKKLAALDVFAKRGGPFWLALWKQLKKRPAFSRELTQLDWAAPQKAAKPRAKTQILSQVICSDINGFEYEHALIKLGLGLIEIVETQPGVIGASPRDLKIGPINGSDWSQLWDPKLKDIYCKLIKTPTRKDPRFSIPSWVTEEESGDSHTMYWVGSILRASVLGGTDYTGSRWKKGQTVTYKGLRSSWYKRRMGMMHSPEAIVGEFATVSSWFSDLLARCLQWPGFESNFVKSVDVRNVANVETLTECLKNRLVELNNLICHSSSLPVLPTIIHRKEEDKLFRIVTVQQLLPYSKDFSIAGVKLNNPKYRSRHREHVAEVCKIVTKTLTAKLLSEESDSVISADLIVFPEVSVHIDDIDIIKRLVDKTKAIVFAGIVFTDLDGKLINRARWFIPDYRESGRQWIFRDQGKGNLTKGELSMGVSSYRPCQHLLEVHGHPEGPFTISGAICYDATDIRLAADLRDKTDLFVVSAHNRDVNTFDNMAAALQYHMFQHVVIANIGEFGGSTIQAPFKQPYDRLISHVHGVNQISINTADIDLAAFRRKSSHYKEIKTKPAGF